MKAIQGNSVLIAGFGREGSSVLEYLQKNYSHLDIVIADRNPQKVADLGCPTLSGDSYLATVGDFDTVVRSPGIPKHTKELEQAKHITTATNIFFSECEGIVVGVTGTKGKSTTSSLIYHILKRSGKDAALVGNIGTTALDVLSDSSRKTLFVMELSSYQLDDVNYSPHIAVVLPLYNEHLNYHGSFSAYVDAKSNIARFQSNKDHVVYYRNNRYSSEIAQSSKGQRLPYPGTKEQHYLGKCLHGLPPSSTCWIEKDCIWVGGDQVKTQQLIQIPDVPLLGTANLENTLAAVTAALILQIDPREIKKAIATFKALEHRLEPVGTYRGVTYYNDSLATIPEATIHAIEALRNEVDTLIAGGFDRGLDYTHLSQHIFNSSIRNLILLPTTGDKIKSALLKEYPPTGIRIMMVQSMEEAVKIADELTQQGNVCLMSPASASFNLFKDYAERGNVFKHAVMALEKRMQTV